MTAKRRRRILKDFTITELSAVDRPSQEHARAVLMKRADDQQETHVMEKIASFDDAVSAIAAVERIPVHEAMRKARTQFESLFTKYQREGDDRVAKAADAARPAPVSKAERDFDDLVGDVARRDGIPRSRAMSAARERYPDEFEAAYGEGRS